MINHKADQHGSQVKRKGQQKNIKLIKSNIVFHPRPKNPDSSSLEDVKYCCNFCDKTMKTKRLLLSHMKSHTSLFPFACEYCINRFDNQKELDAHVIDIHDDNKEKLIFFCDLCGVSGNNKEGMENHMIDDHFIKECEDGRIRQQKKKLVNILKCRFCKARYSNLTKVKRHELRIHKIVTKCEHCDEEFDNVNDMNNHVKVSHNKLVRQLEPHEVEICLKCCKCEQENSTKDELMEHIEKHRQSFETNDIRTPCLLCKATFDTYDKFVEHNLSHTSPKTHECLECRKRMPLDKVMHHLNYAHRYTNQKGEKVQCKKCFLMIKPEKLKIHNRNRHSSDSLHICPICAKSLATATSLDQHIRYFLFFSMQLFD